VHDPSGAVVHGAKATAKKAGFKKVVSEVVELNVQERVAINMALQLEQISEEMLGTGAAPLLETETSELGQVVGQKRVSNLAGSQRQIQFALKFSF